MEIEPYFLCNQRVAYVQIPELHKENSEPDSFCILVSVTVFVILVCSISPVLNGAFKVPLKFSISSFKFECGLQKYASVCPLF